MEDRSGYVYILRAQKPHDECYKIGRTNNPKRRLRDFGVKLPYRVEPVLIATVEDMFVEEAWLHEQFASKRIDGEWFRLTERDVRLAQIYYKVVEADHLLERLARQLQAAVARDFEPVEIDGHLDRITRIALLIPRAAGRLKRRYLTLYEIRGSH